VLLEVTVRTGTGPCSVVSARSTSLRSATTYDATSPTSRNRTPSTETLGARSEELQSGPGFS